MPIARTSEASRPSSSARNTISRNERITFSDRRVLKKSMAQSARCQSAKSVSSCSDVAGAATCRGGLSGNASPPRAFQVS